MEDMKFLCLDAVANLRRPVFVMVVVIAPIFSGRSNIMDTVEYIGFQLDKKTAKENGGSAVDGLLVCFWLQSIFLTLVKGRDTTNWQMVHVGTSRSAGVWIALQ
jgi:hypothetical protein